MHNVAVADDLSDLCGFTLPKPFCRLAHFVCYWLERDIEDGLPLTARLRWNASYRIKKHHFPTGEREAQT